MVKYISILSIYIIILHSYNYLIDFHIIYFYLLIFFLANYLFFKKKFSKFFFISFFFLWIIYFWVLFFINYNITFSFYLLFILNKFKYVLYYLFQ